MALVAIPVIVAIGLIIMIVVAPSDDEIEKRKAEKQREKYKKEQQEIYADLLATPQWQNKRQGILERDRGTCQWCGRVPTHPQVHHRYYLRYPNGEKVKPWEYPDDALITLCPRCHKWWHDNHPNKIYYKSWTERLDKNSQ